ncbi:MAG: hypothetical protein IPL46_02665 [Saprospiraceae bacterium]|nr:hypothetical protein [Saprospiraceae bacterium]
MKSIALKSGCIALVLVFGLAWMNAQNEGTYNPGNGTTIWPLPGGDVVVYDSRSSDVHVCRHTGTDGPCERTDCNEDEEGCVEILEDASEGKTPPPPDDGDDSGGDSGSESTQAMQNIISEFHKFRKGKEGRIFFRSKEGKWVIIKDVKTWNRRVLTSL